MATQQDMYDLAMQHFSAGRVDQAEGIFRSILDSAPGHTDCLNSLGVIAAHRAQWDEAIRYVALAIAGNSSHPDFHWNLGMIREKIGQPEAALRSYRTSLKLQPQPDHLADYSTCLLGLGRMDEAEAGYRQALNLDPNHVSAYVNLGETLRRKGRLDDAAALLNQALARGLNAPSLYYNLSAVLIEQRKVDDAQVICETGLTHFPDDHQLNTRVTVLLTDKGDMAGAARYAHRALSGDSTTSEAWFALGALMGQAIFDIDNEATRNIMVRALRRPEIRPSEIAPSIISSLEVDPTVADLLTRFDGGEALAGATLAATCERLAGNAVLLCLMETVPLISRPLERLMTATRRGLLFEPDIMATASTAGPFFAALASQCFINEYIYHETPDETEALATLMAASFADDAFPSPARLALIAAYRPLHSLAGVERVGLTAAYRSLLAPAEAERLTKNDWSPPFVAMIRQQLVEPLEERRLRAGIPNLTELSDAVSLKVRAQYEENPYPRWINAGRASHIFSLSTMMAEGAFDPSRRLDILIAGCGTGQHPVYATTHYPQAQFLAVDLSLASLSYAQRKTAELGIDCIDYAQADILHLDSLGRTFDVIECLGVLHHLADPMAGWRVLVDLLRPGGIIRIGLYSELARHQVIRARALIAENGWGTSADDIRRCRQMIHNLPPDHPLASITNWRDFYSLSECRDLLFHVQEHRYTLPQIKLTLEDLGLEFGGFSLSSPKTVRDFRARFPEKTAISNLSLWHQFETDNPETFMSMYQFWARKRPQAISVTAKRPGRPKAPSKKPEC